jgi:hypothetical protein
VPYAPYRDRCFDVIARMHSQQYKFYGTGVLASIGVGPIFSLRVYLIANKGVLKVSDCFVTVVVSFQRTISTISQKTP